MPLVKCDFDRAFSLNPHEKQLFYNKMSSTVVRLRNVDQEDNIYAQGGGVFVRGGYVLTTSNLLQQYGRDSKIFVYTKDNKRYKATPFLAPTPPNKLLQLLKIDGDVDVDALSFAEIADIQLGRGFEVLFIGHSYNLDFSFTTGIMCAERSVWELNLKRNEKVLNLDVKRDQDRAVVQVSQLCGGNNSEASMAEGCPMFNCFGEVVALYGFCGNDFDIGLPTTKELVDKMLSGGKMLDTRSKKSGSSTSASSKKRKRGCNF